MQCFVARGGSAAERWKDRASHAGQAVVFAALGVAAALALTFPFNLVVGIPLYLWWAQRMAG